MMSRSAQQEKKKKKLQRISKQPLTISNSQSIHNYNFIATKWMPHQQVKEMKKKKKKSAFLHLAMIHVFLYYFLFHLSRRSKPCFAVCLLVRAPLMDHLRGICCNRTRRPQLHNLRRRSLEVGPHSPVRRPLKRAHILQ